MDCSLRINEEKISKIREGRRRQDGIQEVKLGTHIQHSVVVLPPSYEEWQRYISSELRQPNSPYHYVPKTEKPVIPATQTIREQAERIWKTLSIKL